MAQVLLHRRVWLSVILLAILGLSVLAAWWLVEVRRLPVARAEDVLRRIRAQGLVHYWGSRPTTRWYLIQDHTSRAVGYLVRTRRPSREGFSGLTLHHVGDAHHGESWSLDTAVTAGAYVATMDGRGLPDTQIVLRNGQVTVIQPRAGRADRAAERAPANYIPEGLTSLVIAEVAKTSSPARFRFVLNAESILGGGLHFTSLTMTPQGEGKVRVRSQFLQGVSDDVYHLDATGEVFRIDDRLGGATTRLTDLRSLAGEFPEVLDLQRDLETDVEGGEGDSNAEQRDVPTVHEVLQAAL